ncbi:carboxy terminal-processing peptidase [Chryseobacterium sp.]|uniref:carboxy terminal-processing peptidase n=1 Tax=Chryseobacterium sp. TaxID=1871047 RepID=UPI0023F444A0|nr:carboxy terminal-processing peptidase [Chryseobacterium sp.]
MLKNFRTVRFLLLLLLTFFAFGFRPPGNEEEKMQIIMVNTKNILSYLHYSPKPINDAYSKEVYKQYFESIDPTKTYFLQSDMDEFRKYETKLDDYLNTGDLTFYKLTVDKLSQRIDEIDTMTKDIFSKPINLEEDEILTLEPKLKNAPANKQQQYNEWRKYVKYNILQEIESLNRKSEEKKKDNSTNEENSSKPKILSQDEKIKKATENVKDLLEEKFIRFRKRQKMDSFTVYMNAYTHIFDPHTNYYSPQGRKDFEMDFKGKIIGIGAVIQEKKGSLYIGTLSIGAPAWKTKQLTEGDKILKIKSTPDTEPVNVVDMLSGEAIKLIRGEKGTPITLTVQKKDGTIQEVTMNREEISIEDTFAKSIIVNASDKKYGLINLPKFNADFEDKDGRNASDDIKNEIIKLKEQNIQGIVLDLRGNSGGSLTEVGDIMGLFMDAGPYVQVKDGNGKITTLKNKNEAPIWNGPLVILQNELSASAAEILAGVMQDYGRAVIMGSPVSYGKGTVQVFVDLNRFLNTEEDFGSVKLTIQKYYRITGESTQRKGVSSDIPMKDIFSYAEIGEKYDDYALAWDKIPGTTFNKQNFLNIQALQKVSTERIAKNDNYKLLLEYAQWRENLGKEKTVPLSIQKYSGLMKQRKTEDDKFKILKTWENGLTFTMYPKDIEREKNDAAFKSKSEAWVKNLQKDLYLREAINIVEDWEVRS